MIGHGSLLGFIGILPGAGAALASILRVEKRIGNKSLESGVAAPSANNAACTGFCALLSLGIPARAQLQFY